MYAMSSVITVVPVPELTALAMFGFAALGALAFFGAHRRASIARAAGGWSFDIDVERFTLTAAQNAGLHDEKSHEQDQYDDGHNCEGIYSASTISF